ncbi:hypothetical protein D3C84_670950 [compost metagenome]
MRLFYRFGHGVEARGQLAQFVLGLMVDPHLEITASKALGCVHQFLEGRDDAVLQLVQTDQQDNHGGEQRHALDHLLPALLLLALALEQADELVQLLNERPGLGLKRHGIAAFQCRAQRLAPLLLELPIAGLQRGGRAIFQHGLE